MTATVTVGGLLPGDVVSMGGRQAVYIEQAVHPIYGGLRLVVSEAGRRDVEPRRPRHPPGGRRGPDHDTRGTTGGAPVGAAPTGRAAMATTEGRRLTMGWGERHGPLMGTGTTGEMALAQEALAAVGIKKPNLALAAIEAAGVIDRHHADFCAIDKIIRDAEQAAPVFIDGEHVTELRKIVRPC